MAIFRRPESSSAGMFVLTTLLFIVGVANCADELSSNFYWKTCPKAVSTITSVIRDAVEKEYRIGASLLRLHFHDCFVNGCDASILLDDTTTFTGEKTALANSKSARGFEVIDTAKSKLESLCPGVVSCADILAVAARDSVAILGGPSWVVQLGRRDSRRASLDDANNQIPSPLMDLSDLTSAFSKKGFTPKEMVALSGAHTIGQAKCSSFRARAHNETNIDATFATSLKSTCPTTGGDDSLAPLDAKTPVTFDNGFFKNLVDNKGLLHSDQQLFSGGGGSGATDSNVTTYSNHPLIFAVDFAKAAVKMGNLSPLTGTAGEIRTDCRKIN